MTVPSDPQSMVYAFSSVVTYSGSDQQKQQFRIRDFECRNQCQVEGQYLPRYVADSDCVLRCIHSECFERFVLNYEVNQVEAGSLAVGAG